jgi:hypothetical protein
LDEEQTYSPSVDPRRGDRSDGEDALTALVLVVLLVSPLLAPLTMALDVLTVVVAGSGLAWLAYARYG